MCSEGMDQDSRSQLVDIHTYDSTSSLKGKCKCSLIISHSFNMDFDASPVLLLPSWWAEPACGFQKLPFDAIRWQNRGTTCRVSKIHLWIPQFLYAQKQVVAVHRIKTGWQFGHISFYHTLQHCFIQPSVIFSASSTSFHKCVLSAPSKKKKRSPSFVYS